ncbi:MAG: hypothetical protein QM496_15865 [Verrucomicrobiota bacterium]
MKKLAIIALMMVTPHVLAQEDLGTLIFHDDFDRSESQELKDEPGNEWTTSSERTAKGHKEVDLRDGYMHIYTHAEANHATSVRHAFAFKDGTIGLKLRFENEKDSIKLNFTDLGEKSVHAGHLFNVTISPSAVSLSDLKTGVMNNELRAARSNQSLSDEQKVELAKKNKTFTHKLELGKWYQVHATVEGDKVSCRINGQLIASFASPGFAHESKTLIRLLVPAKVDVDEVRIWRR